MSEQAASYNVKNQPIKTLAAFQNHACALPYSDPNYKPPTPEEVAALIRLAGWSQSETAKLVGVSYNPKKGSSTIRKWEATPHSKEYRAINYAAWRLMLLYTGVVNIENR